MKNDERNHDALGALASANLEAQDQMVAALKEHREAAGLSLEDVVRRCDADAEEVLDLEQFGVASAAFLRRYATAIGVVIEFSVVPARTAG